MIKILACLAIFITTGLCNDLLLQQNPNLQFSDHRFETLPKPCTRRIIPNPVIDSQWVPYLPPYLQVASEPKSLIGEIHQVEKSMLPSAKSEINDSNLPNSDEKGNRNEEQTQSADNSSENEIKPLQNENNLRDLEITANERKPDTSNDVNCEETHQNEQQNYYRRFLSDTEDLANDKVAQSNDDDELVNPVNRAGVKTLSDSKSPFFGNSRVCYACTSAGNPNCLSPNKRTTVKYCQRDRDSCVTKSYENNNELVVIRDCASSCREATVTGLEPKYKNCKLCHTDLCNGAASITTHVFMVLLFIATFFKCTRSAGLLSS